MVVEYILQAKIHLCSTQVLSGPGSGPDPGPDLCLRQNVTINPGQDPDPGHSKVMVNSW